MKTITNRQFKRGTHEERLAEGESLRVIKSSGKSFIVKRESPAVSMSKLHEEIMAEIPSENESQPNNISSRLDEVRE